VEGVTEVNAAQKGGVSKSDFAGTSRLVSPDRRSSNLPDRIAVEKVDPIGRTGADPNTRPLT
jgi:hypothetical protein